MSQASGGEIQIGAVAGSGDHIFRSEITDITLYTRDFTYHKILQYEDKILFINTGSFTQYGIIVVLNSSFQISSVYNI